MKYADFYKSLIIEAFGDSERIKWKQQVPTLTNRIINQYIEDFDTIRQSKPAVAQYDIQNLSVKSGSDRFDISKYKNWSDFETFVDYVKSQIDLEKIKGKQFKNIEIDAKPLVSANGLEIYYAKNSEACIHYKGNIPYGWCISRNVNNLYNAYRYRENEPSFYFVKDIEATKKEFEQPFAGTFKNPWHFFVIQKDKTGQYIVTSANNDGDLQMTWDKLVSIQPKLANLEHYFVNIPLTGQERSIYNKFKKQISVEEFVKLPFKQKELYMDIFPDTITHELFAAMPDELKNKYISYGLGLPRQGYELIKSNKSLMKRFGQIIERRLTLVNERQLNIRSIKNGEWAYLFETVDGEKILFKCLLDNTSVIISVLEHAVSKEYQVDSEKIIEKILSDVPKLSDQNILQLVRFSKNPSTVIKTIIQSKKGNFNVFANILNDYSRDNVSFNVQLPQVQNITEYIDILLQLNKQYTAPSTDTQEYFLPPHITADIIRKAASASQLDDVVEIFKKNNYAINLDDRESENVLYGHGWNDKNAYYSIAKLLILTQKNNLSESTIKTFFRVLPEKISADQMDTIIDLLISVKPNLSTETIESILKTTTNPIIVMHNIVSNYKYVNKSIHDALFFILSPHSIDREKTPLSLVETLMELALKYSSSEDISDVDKLNLLIIHPDQNKILELMKKYHVNLPVNFFKKEYIEYMLHRSLYPVKIANFLITNKLPVKINSRNIISVLRISRRPAELIDAFNLLKIPIVLSDTGIKNLLLKNNFKRMLYSKERSSEYLKLLTKKLSTVVGRERMLNIIAKLKLNYLNLHNSVDEIHKQYTNYYRYLLNENEPKFNVAPYSQHPKGDIGWKGKMVYTTPDKFLSLAKKLTHPSEESLAWLRSEMQAGKPIPHLMLWVDMNKQKVVGHEGRHRATVARELGINEIPVFVYTGGGYTRVPHWTERDHDIVDNLKFSPET